MQKIITKGRMSSLIGHNLWHSVCTEALRLIDSVNYLNLLELCISRAKSSQNQSISRGNEIKKESIYDGEDSVKI